MKKMVLFLIMFTISSASANISINRELYAGGDGTSEEISLSGVNYQNDAYVSHGSVYEDASFESYSDNASISDRVDIDSGLGTAMGLEGQELDGSRTVSVSSSSFLALNYGFSNGQSDIVSFSGQSYGREKLDLENGYFSNAIMATPTSFYHSGAGVGLLDNDYQSNSMNHYLELALNGKYSKINLQLDCTKDDGVRQAAYSWNSGVGADTASLGYTSISVGTSAGNAQMDAKVNGESSELSPKEVSRHIYPLALDESIKADGDGAFDDNDLSQMTDLLKRAGVSQTIYMSYTLE